LKGRLDEYLVFCHAHGKGARASALHGDLKENVAGLSDHRPVGRAGVLELAGVGDADAATITATREDATDGLLAQFGRRRTEPRRRYRKFVAEGGASVGSGLRQQIHFGDDTFAAKMQEKVPVQTDQLNIQRSQRRRPAPPLEAIAAEHPERNAAIVSAHATGTYSYREIADHFGLHPATVGRVIRS